MKIEIEYEIIKYHLFKKTVETVKRVYTINELKFLLSKDGKVKNKLSILTDNEIIQTFINKYNDDIFSDVYIYKYEIKK